jgi:hypothetical protein
MLCSRILTQTNNGYVRDTTEHNYPRVTPLQISVPLSFFPTLHYTIIYYLSEATPISSYFTIITSGSALNKYAAIITTKRHCVPRRLPFRRLSSLPVLCQVRHMLVASIIDFPGDAQAPLNLLNIHMLSLCSQIVIVYLAGAHFGDLSSRSYTRITPRIYFIH